eukprot:scaffold6136_cov96-Isochrysis_galbana.AAC.4
MRRRGWSWHLFWGLLLRRNSPRHPIWSMHCRGWQRRAAVRTSAQRLATPRCSVPRRRRSHRDLPGYPCVLALVAPSPGPCTAVLDHLFASGSGPCTAVPDHLFASGSGPCTAVPDHLFASGSGPCTAVPDHLFASGSGPCTAVPDHLFASGSWALPHVPGCPRAMARDAAAPPAPSAGGDSLFRCRHLLALQEPLHRENRRHRLTCEHRLPCEHRLTCEMAR